MKKYQLPKEFGEKWITALRNGEYKQGKDRLKDIFGGYCCLGVACAMQGIDDFKDNQWIGGRSAWSLTIPEINSIPELLKGTPAQSDFVGDVSKMNDDGIPFHEIADWIETNVEFI